MATRKSSRKTKTPEYYGVGNAKDLSAMLEERSAEEGAVGGLPGVSHDSPSKKIPTAKQKDVTADHLETERNLILMEMGRDIVKVEQLMASMGSRTRILKITERLKEAFADLHEVTNQMVNKTNDVEAMKEAVKVMRRMKAEQNDLEDNVVQHLEEREGEAPSVITVVSTEKSASVRDEKQVIAEEPNEEKDDDEMSETSQASDRSVASQSAKIRAEVAAMKVQQEKKRYARELQIVEAQQKLAISKLQDEEERAKLESEMWDNLSETKGNELQQKGNGATGKTRRTDADDQRVSESRNKAENPLERMVHSVEASRMAKPQGQSTPIKESMREPAFQTKDVQQFFMGMAKPRLPIFNGRQRNYEDWRAQFDVFVDQANVPVRYKVTMLRDALSGHPLSLVEKLGFTEAQYQMAIFKLDQRYGGESRALQRYIDDLLDIQDVAEGDLPSLETLANQLCDVIAKLGDSDHVQELVGHTSLYTLVKRKVPTSLLVKYAETRRPNDVDGLASFTKWLNGQVALMIEMSEARAPRMSEARAPRQMEKPRRPPPKDLPKHQGKASNYGSTTKQDNPQAESEHQEKKLECAICKQSHHVTQCEDWKAASVDDRWKIAKSSSLCYRCLFPNHMGRYCGKDKKKCGIDGCERTHHRQLHAKSKKPEAVNNFGVSEDGQVCPRKVALRVVPVDVAGEDGIILRLNAFLDDGSDSSYITRDVATALGVSIEDQDLSLSMLTEQANLKSGLAAVTVHSLDGNISAKVGTRVLDSLCRNLKPLSWNRLKDRWDHLREVDFPKIEGSTVDVLIGADHPELTLALEERMGSPGEPVARHTPLGWTCTGSVEMAPDLRVEENGAALSCFALSDRQIDESLRALWNMDVLTPHCDTLRTQEDDEILARTNESKVYREDGHYEVAIPWLQNPPRLPNNFEEARRRLVSLERSLHRKPKLAALYCEGMQQNVDKGYLVKIPSDVRSGWYLPHFAVVREDKETTKVRIVFDSASKCQGTSLNDQMHAGPKLQREIFDILVRFRRGRVALAGDIKEMFSQVFLKPEDRQYHRLLWRGLRTSEEIEVYESTRLTFGDKASPFLAQHVLQSHAEKRRDEYPEVARVCLESTYMDDAIDSVDSPEEAIELRKALTKVLKEAGFLIRRWCSNSEEVLVDVPIEDRAKGSLEVQDSTLPSIKALGVRWNAATDIFEFSTSQIKVPVTVTKRTLLSRVATLFDPMQWLAPFTIRVKILLQQTWIEGLQWDEPLSPSLTTAVEGWFEELDRIEGISLPRCYFKALPSGEISLHTFSDASSKAYAAATYVRHAKEDGEVEIALVAAKARVAPLRAVSIPRLELMGAVLGYRLTRKITALLRLTSAHVTYWTDSMDVVHWVRSQSRQYKPFVANRVSELQSESVPSQWRFVPGTENPADVATRGMSAQEMMEVNVWFDGPEFLRGPEQQWPETRVKPALVSVEAEVEISKANCHATVTNMTKSDELVSYLKFSSWVRLVRSTAWVLRFIRRLKERCSLKIGEKPSRGLQKSPADKLEVEPLTADEFRDAETALFRDVQRKAFPEIVKSLEIGKPMGKSQLADLSPFLDQDGVLRVGGRLQSSSLPFNARHPVILPNRNHVSMLIIRRAHRVAGHSRGVNAILAEVRQQCWIVRGREMVKNVAYQCYLCRRHKDQTAQQIMAPLPSSRSKMSLRAFCNSGVDYAGPFVVKLTRRVTAKRYLCLFTCMQTRGVHLEVAYSMDTDGFLMALSRMVARRGRPEEIVSDNGTNFVGAERQLRELMAEWDNEKIVDSATNQGIKWRFNPPYGSHHGGVFEALIKSAKKALYAIFGESRLTDEELLTAVTQVEGLLNSRPLTYCSSDPLDEEVLTPNHFIFGQCGGPLAPRVPAEILHSPRNRWRVVQSMMAKFWTRWSKEYLAAQQQRRKWKEVQEELKIGDVVVMYDPGRPRASWPLGRVADTFPSEDGHVRTVRVVSRGKEYVRPITRLVPLVTE